MRWIIIGIFPLCFFMNQDVVTGETNIYKNMVCNEAGRVMENLRTCRISMKGDTNAEIICHSGRQGGTGERINTCRLQVHDWGQVSPYAHTARIWRCADKTAEVFLFSSDFEQDAMRCKIVCGLCEGGWKTAHEGDKEH
ncbi:MAG: hypothetical protein CSYNP_02388 [Syntrophus sp. SKADARSKE-3]|nr:hypothetical protein [Syntrophus sp. SKADARSKE-3]